jgi:hypothetical protein
MKHIARIFTDGSAIGNPGPGGWGAVVIQGNKRREMSGALPPKGSAANWRSRLTCFNWQKFPLTLLLLLYLYLQNYHLREP